MLKNTPDEIVAGGAFGVYMQKHVRERESAKGVNIVLIINIF